MSMRNWENKQVPVLTSQDEHRRIEKFRSKDDRHPNERIVGLEID